MLTIFSIPKAFKGPMDVIQRNAIESWTRLEPKCEVILLGDDPGTDQAAHDLGVRYIPNINRNEFGTPLLDHAFQLADDEATHPLLCYVNADIILMRDLIPAVKEIQNYTDKFLMTARRWNLDVPDPIDFDSGWQDRLLLDLQRSGGLGNHAQIDFWVYPRYLLTGIPPLAVGRIAFESWCLYKARSVKADLIDSTKTIINVHQNHDFSHHPDGELGIGRGIEAQRNREMVGGKSYFFVIRDRTHIYNRKGLKRARDGWWLWRGLRTSQVLPVDAPAPMKLMLKAMNSVINAVRYTLVLVARGIRR